MNVVGFVIFFFVQYYRTLKRPVEVTPNDKVDINHISICFGLSKGPPQGLLFISCVSFDLVEETANY